MVQPLRATRKSVYHTFVIRLRTSKHVVGQINVLTNFSRNFEIPYFQFLVVLYNCNAEREPHESRFVEDSIKFKKIANHVRNLTIDATLIAGN